MDPLLGLRRHLCTWLFVMRWKPIEKVSDDDAFELVPVPFQGVETLRATQQQHSGWANCSSLGFT